MNQLSPQGFGSASAGPGGFPQAPPLSRDNPGRLVPAKPGFLPGAIQGRGPAASAAANAPARKETELAGSAPVQSELVNGLPFGGAAPPAAKPALDGLPFVERPHPPVEKTLLDNGLPFAHGAAAAPAIPVTATGSVQPPPRVLTPPPGFVAVSNVEAAPPVAAPPAEVPHGGQNGTVEVAAPVQSASIDSVAPPGFAPVPPPAVVAPAPTSTPSTPPEPVPATVDGAALASAEPTIDGDSPWVREPVAKVADAPTAVEAEVPSTPPEAQKKANRLPLLIGLVVVLLGAVATVAFVFRNSILSSDNKDARSSATATAAAPTATATAKATATATATEPEKTAAPTATATATAVATETAAVPSAQASAAPTTAPTQPPVVQLPVQRPPVQYPPYHPPVGVPQPGGKFDPGGI